VTGKQPPPIQPPVKVLVMIFDAHDEWAGVPLHQAIVRELEKHHLAGATVVRGVTGYGPHRSLHRKGLLEPHDEPMTLLVIENEGKLRAALPTLRPMVAEGIFVMFDAEVIPLP
jgi:uncharacterized protein